jgi:hypothetical protein
MNDYCLSYEYPEFDFESRDDLIDEYHKCLNEGWYYEDKLYENQTSRYLIQNSIHSRYTMDYGFFPCDQQM